MDFLAKQQGRPFTSRINVSDVPLSHMAARADNVKGHLSSIAPEEAGLWFYMMNHAYSIVQQRYHKYEPLEQGVLSIVEEYYRSMNTESVRMFTYLLLICTRETRHIQNLSSMKSHSEAGNHPSPCFTFTGKIKSAGSDGAVAKFLSDPPKTTLGPYCAYMHDLFYYGNWSGGFGGKAWADVARVLRDFVQGTITAEMMMDTAFTLCHNNGPIFNKGILFNMYNHTAIIKILDVQRSGQIPQLVAEQGVGHVTPPMKEFQVRCAELFGPEFDGYVDWYQVEALGAMKTYSSEKNKQNQEYGMPKDIALKVELEKKKKEQALAEEQKKFIWIMPDTKLSKLSREEVHAA